MRSETYDFDGFVGDFKELLIQFIQMKRSLGYDYVAETGHLKSFSQFSLNYTIKNHTITKELADAWTGKRPNERERTMAHRISVLRQFSLFLSNLGYDEYIPVCRAKIDRHSYVPYIYSPEQLRNFFAECDNLKPHPLSNRHMVYPAIYRLLYGCGLRISEALSLKGKDVDLKQGIVTIRGSKFNKDRLIPMSTSLTRYLKDYSLKIHILSTPEDFFFMKRDKTRLRSDTVYKNFRHILWKIEISHGGKRRGPRLHDFRHTFAVHSLNQMVRQGMDLYYALPLLSTYLGHASVAATEGYVRLTEETYPGILDTVSRVCAYVFPGVNAT